VSAPDQTTLPDLLALLGKIGAEQQEGVLVVEAGQASQHLYFAGGRMTWLFERKEWNERLAAMLKASGAVGEGDLRMALHVQRNSGEPLGDVLCKTGITTPDQIAAHVRIHAEEDLCEIVETGQASWRFDEGPPDVNMLDVHARTVECMFPVEDIIAHIQQRAEGWERIRDVLPSSEEIIVPAEDHPGTSSLGEADPEKERLNATLLMEIDGQKSAAEAIAAAGLPKLTGARVLVGLLDSGRVRLLNAEEIWNRVNAIVEQDRLPERIPFLHMVLARGPDPKAYTALGELYEKMGNKVQAAEHFKHVVEYHRERDEIREALGMLRRLTRLVPADVELRAQLFQLSIEGDDEARAIDEGRRLARLYQSAGHHAEAHDVYKMLSSVAPENVALQQELADRFLELDDLDAALQRYSSIESRLTDTGRADEIIAFYEKVRDKFPDRPELRERVKEIRRATGRGWRLSLKCAAVIILVLLVLGGGAAYGYRHVTSRRAFAHTKQQADGLVKDYNFAGARAMYETFLREYSGILFKGEVLAALDAIKQAEARKREELAREAALKNPEIKRLEAAGRYLEAASLCGEIADILKHDPSQAALWRQRQAHYRRVVREFDDLVQRAQALEKAGQVQQAFDLCVEIRDGYVDLWRAKGLRFPLRVESEPTGADVSVNRRKVGTTPCVVHYVPEMPPVIRVSKPGFKEVNESLTGRLDKATLLAVLERHWKWRYKMRAAVEAAPCLQDAPGPAGAGPRLYVADRDGWIACVDAATGQQRWIERALSKRAITASPRVQGDTLYATCHGGGVYALDANTGKLRWPRNIRCLITASPVYWQGPEGGVVLVAGTDRKLYAFGARQPVELWQVEAEGAIESAPLIHDGLAIFGSRDGRVYAVKAGGGALEWPPVKLGGKTGRKGPISWPLAADDGKLYPISGDDYLWCIRAADGHVVWSRALPVPPNAGALVTRGLVIVPAGENLLLAFDAEKGEKRWRFEASAKIVATPVSAGDTVCFGCTNGAVYVIGAADGALRWRTRVEGAVVASPAASNDWLYVVSDAGDVYAFPLAE